PRGQRRYPTHPQHRGHAQSSPSEINVARVKEDVGCFKILGRLTADETQGHMTMDTDRLCQADGGTDLRCGEIIKRKGKKDDFTFRHEKVFRRWLCRCPHRPPSKNQMLDSSLRLASNRPR